MEKKSNLVDQVLFKKFSQQTLTLNHKKFKNLYLPNKKDLGYFLAFTNTCLSITDYSTMADKLRQNLVLENFFLKKNLCSTIEQLGLPKNFKSSFSFQ